MYKCLLAVVSRKRMEEGIMAMVMDMATEIKMLAGLKKALTLWLLSLKGEAKT